MEFDYDLIVIGGGIHGVGVAQAAAANGYSVLVLEKEALASGTSSRSSKLIHGGLRYLESGEISLVRECLQERDRLLKLAPELVQLKPFYIPIFATTRRRSWQLRVGLSLYALLAGLRRSARFRTLRRDEWLGLDGLITDDLNTVFEYRDGQTDDALLTQAVMNSAQTLGAELKMPAVLTGVRLDEQGSIVEYRQGNELMTTRCRVLINAAGPWANQILALIKPLPELGNFDLVQGTHILLPGKLAKGIYYLEAPQDGRAVFVMPRGDNTLIGTTETPYQGDPDQVSPLAEEIEYLLTVLRHYFPAHPGSQTTELTSSYAGLRVLPAGQGRPFSRVREMTLVTDCTQQPRLLTIFGGKLTSYRADAEKVMRKLRVSLPVRNKLADTRELPLTRP